MGDAIFKDRSAAGQVLAGRLAVYAHRPDVIVLALPRGGVPVAFQVAQALHVPLDVFVVRKLGVPGHEELAMGAIASDCRGATVGEKPFVRVLNQDIVRELGIPERVIDAITALEQQELVRRERAYRDDSPPPTVQGKTVILIDDGLATGSTMRAAVRALRQCEPARLVVAVPVSSHEACEDLSVEVDEMICAALPEPFRGVGLWYQEFGQTTDDEVRELLHRSDVPNGV